MPVGIPIIFPAAEQVDRNTWIFVDMFTKKRLAISITTVACLALLYAGGLWLLTWWFVLSDHERTSLLFSSSPHCHAPCWETIIPNHSDESSLINTIDSLPFYRAFNQSIITQTKYERHYRWQDHALDMSVDIEVTLDTVKTITFTLSRATSLPLEEVLNYLGTPDTYTAHHVDGVEREFVIWRLFYEKSGAVIELWKEIDGSSRVVCEQEVDSTTHLRNIYFLQPGSSTQLGRELGIDRNNRIWDGLSIMPLTDTRCQ